LSETALNAELAIRLAGWRVLPVVTITSAAEALGVAEACLEGGLKAIEITLRTPQAVEAIAEVVKRFPELQTGAGSVRNAAQLGAAREAGARFAVSPGSSPELLLQANRLGIALLPGVATASEVMAAVDAGYRCLKLFPAQALGGVAALRQLAGPFPDVRFCPTGGISAATAPAFLALENVVCVGGSWIAESSLVAARDWKGIAQRAREASQLAT